MTAVEPVHDQYHTDADQLIQPEDQAVIGDVPGLLRQLATMANRVDEDGRVLPFAAGTVAFYPTPTGGIYAVANIIEGDPSILGEQRGEIPSGMIRAMAAIMGGGPVAKMRGIFGGRKAIRGQ